MAEEVLIAEVEGPRGTASIFEVTLRNEQAIEVEYCVVLGDERQSAPSLGEAHLIANALTGLDDEN